MTTGKWIGNQLRTWSFNLMSYDVQGLNSGLRWNPNIFVRQIQNNIFFCTLSKKKSLSDKV